MEIKINPENLSSKMSIKEQIEFLNNNIKDIVDYFVYASWKNKQMRSLYYPETLEMEYDEYFEYYNNNFRPKEEVLKQECTDLINDGYSLKFQLDAWVV